MLVATFFCAATAAQRAPVFDDAYGYTIFDDSSARCVLQPMDIQSTGNSLKLMPSQGSPDRLDEGVATLALESAFQFYGADTNTLAVSTNGYAALGLASLAEGGGDFSNDCPLPAVPGNESPAFARIMALHDDLIGRGSILAEYFGACPRGSGTSADGACTVIQWQDWEFVDNQERLSFQVVLYHASASIAIQYLSLPAIAFASATVGVQNATATSAGSPICNSSTFERSAGAYCFYDPRFPSLIQQDTVFVGSFE